MVEEDHERLHLSHHCSIKSNKNKIHHRGLDLVKQSWMVLAEGKKSNKFKKKQLMIKSVNQLFQENVLFHFSKQKWIPDKELYGQSGTVIDNSSLNMSREQIFTFTIWTTRSLQ